MKSQAALWAAIAAAMLFANNVRGDSIVAFGLTNTALGNASIEATNGLLVASGLSSNGTDGLSIALGEADAGVFVYLNAESYVEVGDYMAVAAFGLVGGVSNQLIGTISGRKNAWGQFPVWVDFSPLGTSQLVFEIYSGTHLKAKFTNQSAEAVVRADYNGYQLARANPFWRLDDGSPGALFEFEGQNGFDLPGNPDPHSIFGNRLFVRPLNPTNIVQYVSQVDITSGGIASMEDDRVVGDGLPSFQVNELLLGKFGHGNLVEGGLANASAGLLTVTSLNETDCVVSVDLQFASKFTLFNQPVIPGTNDAPLMISAAANLNRNYLWPISGLEIGHLKLSNTNGTMQIMAEFPAAGTNDAEIQVTVYSNDTLVGTSERFPTAVLVALSGQPAMIAAGALANSTPSPAGVFARFDQSTTFQIGSANQTSFEGNEIRFLSVEPARFDQDIIGTFAGLTALSVSLGGLRVFSITDEISVPPIRPVLHIERVGAEIFLSWDDPNFEFFIESIATLGGGDDFSRAEQGVERIGSLARARYDLSGESQFFRLARYSDIAD